MGETEWADQSGSGRESRWERDELETAGERRRERRTERERWWARDSTDREKEIERWQARDGAGMGR